MFPPRSSCFTILKAVLYGRSDPSSSVVSAGISSLGKYEKAQMSDLQMHTRSSGPGFFLQFMTSSAVLRTKPHNRGLTRTPCPERTIRQQMTVTAHRGPLCGAPAVSSPTARAIICGSLAPGVSPFPPSENKNLRSSWRTVPLKLLWTEDQTDNKPRAKPDNATAPSARIASSEETS